MVNGKRRLHRQLHGNALILMTAGHIKEGKDPGSIMNGARVLPLFYVDSIRGHLSAACPGLNLVQMGREQSQFVACLATTWPGLSCKLVYMGGGAGDMDL